MRIAVCDDDPAFVTRTVAAIQTYTTAKKALCTCDGFVSQKNFLQCCEKTKYDAAVLDIQMPGKSGILTAKDAQLLQPRLPVIFVTSFLEYAPQGYEVNALRYVLKQDFERVFSGALDALWAYLYPPSRTVTLHTKQDDRVFDLKSILYIESLGHHIYLHLTDSVSKISISHRTLAELQAQLESQGFLRVHRSFLINMEHIRRMKNYVVELDTGATFKASERQYPYLRSKYLLWRGASK